MDNKENKNECMWMLMGSIHESDRVTVAKCLDMMEEKDISKEEMISNIESAKEELFTLLFSYFFDVFALREVGAP